MPTIIPSDSADETEHDRLDQELHEDVALARADRHADADLARPLGDADEHDVHHADAADEEADRRDADEQERQRARIACGALLQLGLRVHLKSLSAFVRCGGAGAGSP